MKKTKVKELRGEEWKIEGDLVIKEGKIYVPKNVELRVEIIQLHHDVPVAGHGGHWKTVVKIKEDGLDLFSFRFIFLFSIFRTTRVRVDWSHHHINYLIA